MSNKTEIMLGPSAAKEGNHMIARYEDGKVEILLIESDKARFLSIPTIERYTSRLSELEGKVEFYRRETSKLRDYLEEHKIGKPSQKLFDALYEHIAELEAEKEKNIKWANDAETRAVAADERIVELEAENKRLREEIEAQQVEIVKKDEQLDNHRWIPVTERLPETSDDYAEQVIGLSSAPGTEVPYVVICVAFYDGHFYVLDTFSEIDFSEPLDVVEHQIKTITHWQPLPQPPKEQ